MNAGAAAGAAGAEARPGTVIFILGVSSGEAEREQSDRGGGFEFHALILERRRVTAQGVLCRKSRRMCQRAPRKAINYSPLVS